MQQGRKQSIKNKTKQNKTCHDKKIQARAGNNRKCVSFTWRMRTPHSSVARLTKKIEKKMLLNERDKNS